MIKVSIIMPVYNSIEYLEHAVRSVTGQDFEEMELILVDDGSSDGSGELCDRLAALDPRLRVIHKMNGGICSARNMGLAKAQGEYVGFCDNDDEFLPGLISDNYNLACKYDADLVRYVRIKRMITSEGKIWYTAGSNVHGVLERKDFGREFNRLRKDDGVWTALYRRKLLVDKGICFDTSYKYGEEDHRFNIEFIRHANRIAYNSRAYYVWMQRDVHSTSRKFHEEHLEDILRNADEDYALMELVGIDRIRPADRLRFGINSYVSLLTSLLIMDNCPLDMESEKKLMKRLRDKAIFEFEYDKKVSKELYEENKRLWLTAELFMRGSFGQLLGILKAGNCLLGHMRYK